MAGRRVVFIACSLDGFIAGPGDDLTFLEPAEGQEIEDTFTPFLAGVGVLLMGRRTFDVVSGFGGEWPYGNTPVLVLTRRAIESPVPTVQAVSGTIESAVSRAVEAAGDRDVYIDGGELVRQALDANLVDELVVTVVPRILGHGTPLFAGAAQPHDLELLGQRPLGAGYVELRYRPIR
jgi:dihydrofolate reductase